jgi:FkbM family methyltransferase
VNIHQPSFFNRTAKSAAPMLSKFLMRPPMSRGLRVLSIYLEILQGKGSGAGWDMTAEVDVALRFIPEGDATVFDVGANRGHWSRDIRARRPGVRTRVVQFEPSTTCQETLRSSQDADTTIIGKAVGETSGEVTFFVPEPGSGISSVHRQRDSYFQEFKYTEETVPMTTIDEVIAGHAIPRVDYMKMDVEGNELAALRGAKKSLGAGIIRALAFEFGSSQINARAYFHDFWDFLHPLGFQFGRICPGGRLFPVDEYYEDLEYFRGATNYVAHLPQK